MGKSRHSFHIYRKTELRQEDGTRYAIQGIFTFHAFIHPHCKTRSQYVGSMQLRSSNPCGLCASASDHHLLLMVGNIFVKKPFGSYEDVKHRYKYIQVVPQQLIDLDCLRFKNRVIYQAKQYKIIFLHNIRPFIRQNRFVIYSKRSTGNR